MHGTGTALGDPIEVGAVVAVLGGGAAQPLVLSAGKSWVGHAEAAAGATGLRHALAGLRAASAQAVLHLAAPNPYLEGSLRRPAAGAAGGGGAGWALPRQAGGLPFAGAGGAAAPVRGVSSFAFQGTNAHALLLGAQPAAGAPPAAAPPPPAWRRAFTWAAPAAHLFVGGALPGGGAPGKLVLAVRLEGAGAAFLLDNVIGGAPWLPTSAVLEIAAEAAAAAAGAALAEPRGCGALTLVGVALPSGLPLGGSGADVTAALYAGSGLVEVQAAPRSSGQHCHALLFGSLTRGAGEAPATGGKAGAPTAAAVPSLAARAALLAHVLLSGSAAAAPAAAAAGAFASVDATAAGAPSGLLLQPCALEAALQLEGVSLTGAAATAAGPPPRRGAVSAIGGATVLTIEHDSAVGSEEGGEGESLASEGAPPAAAGSPGPLTIKVPASIAALHAACGSLLAGTPAGAMAAAAARPAAAGGPASLWLLPAGGGGGSGAAHVRDAAFRPLDLSGAPQPPAGAAAEGAARAEEAWTTDLEAWEVEEIVAEAVTGILGQEVGRGARAAGGGGPRRTRRRGGAGPLPGRGAAAARQGCRAGAPACAQVSHDEPLMAAGLDSLGAVELRNALKERLGGLALPPTLLYDFQSIEVGRARPRAGAARSRAPAKDVCCRQAARPRAHARARRRLPLRPCPPAAGHHRVHHGRPRGRAPRGRLAARLRGRARGRAPGRRAGALAAAEAVAAGARAAAAVPRGAGRRQRAERVL